MCIRSYWYLKVVCLMLPVYVLHCHNLLFMHASHLPVSSSGQHKQLLLKKYWTLNYFSFHGVGICMVWQVAGEGITAYERTSHPSNIKTWEVRSYAIIPSLPKLPTVLDSLTNYSKRGMEALQKALLDNRWLLYNLCQWEGFQLFYQILTSGILWCNFQQSPLLQYLISVPSHHEHLCMNKNDLLFKT